MVGLSMYMEEAAMKLGCEVSGYLEVKVMSWTVYIKGLFGNYASTCGTAVGTPSTSGFVRSRCIIKPPEN